MQSDPESIRMRENTQEFLDFVFKQKQSKANDSDIECDTSEVADDKSSENDNGD